MLNRMFLIFFEANKKYFIYLQKNISPQKTSFSYIECSFCKKHKKMKKSFIFFKNICVFLKYHYIYI